MNEPVNSRTDHSSLLFLTTIRCLAGLPVEHSLEFLKVSSQARPEISLYELFFKTIKNEGFFGFTNTILTNCPRRLLREIVRWPIIGYTNDLLNQKYPSIFYGENIYSKIVTSSSSAFFNTLIVMPFEQLMAYRIKEKKSYSTFFKTRFKTEGIGSLYSGIKINLIREYIFCMTYLVLNQEVKKTFDSFDENKHHPVLKQVLTSVFIATGIVTWGLPLDFIKTKIQMDPTLQRQTAIKVAKTLVKRHGIRGFYAGGVPTFVHSVFHATTGSIIFDKISSKNE